MVRRNKRAKPCTIDLGHPDNTVTLPVNSISMVCWSCGGRWWVVGNDGLGKHGRCTCGAKLRPVIQLTRLSLGAVKAALRKVA